MEITTITVIPLISAIVETLKRAVTIPDRYIPLVSVLTSLFICGVSGITSQGIKQDLIVGVIYGLSASGLYDFAKKTTLIK